MNRCMIFFLLCCLAIYKEFIKQRRTKADGKGVLLECLVHVEITEVLSISRKSLDMSHPKLKELLHKYFSEFDSVSTQLEGYDTCYAYMRVSSAGMKEEEFIKLIS